MSQLDTNAFVFGDETGVNIAMARRYARAPQGERVHAAVPVNQGKNLTILGAVSLAGIQAVMTIEGSTDAQVFFTFVHTILVPT